MQRLTRRFADACENMAPERDSQRLSATQVGFVMRAYRESFVREDGSRGLTQSELLERMGEVDSSYARRYSHGTVSRWESGGTRPTAARLQIFGRALGLSDPEVEGLLRMAGLAGAVPVSPPGEAEDWDDGERTAPVVSAEEVGYGLGLVLLRSLFRLVVLRCLPLALGTVGLGYLFAFLGWNVPGGPVAYVGLVIGAVLIQGFLLPDRDGRLREFFWISVFLSLSTPLVQFSSLGMDHYGLYRIGDLHGTHMPYTLALVANLGLAGLAGLMFDLLRSWQYGNGRGMDSAMGRACWVVIPPTALVYAMVAVITNISVSLQLGLLLPVLAISVALMLSARDPGLTPSPQARRLLLYGLLGATLVCAPLGIATIMAVVLSPELPSVLPDHNLLGSWELDFEALGYSREDALHGLNLGYMWHAMTVFVYTLFVVGGKLVVTLYGMGGGEDGDPVGSSRGGAAAARGGARVRRDRVSDIS